MRILPSRATGADGIDCWRRQIDVHRFGRHLAVVHHHDARRAGRAHRAANLERVKQNKQYEAKEADRAKREAALTELEKAGTRVKPVFGSVFYTVSGKDQASARRHVTISVPGATTASLGLPDNGKSGGAWIMGAGTSGAHIMTPGS